MSDNIEELRKEVLELKKVASDNKEATSNFKEWVNGCNEIVKRWQFALIFTNLFWAVVLLAFICFAYLTPTEMNQEQNLPEQTQSQATKGAN